MIRSTIAAILLLSGLGCQTRQVDEQDTGSLPTFLPAPFYSDHAVTKVEQSLDVLLGDVADLVIEGRTSAAVLLIENSRAEAFFIHEINRTHGEATNQKYVFSDVALGDYIHFSIAGAKVGFFLPSACKDMVASSPLPSPGLFFPNAPSVDGAIGFFDVRCRGDVTLRMFSDRNAGESFVGELMVYKLAVNPTDNPSR